jgi:hypothetical protein
MQEGWVKRTLEKMVVYFQDDRNGYLYGRHLVATISHVRALSEKGEGGYDMREVTGLYVGKLIYMRV